MPSDQEAALEAAREFIEDACAHYPHGDGPLITFSSEERIRVLAALILRQCAEAVEAARPEVGKSAEDLARAFHETYERLAPQFGYQTRPDSAKRWDEVPENNRNLMIAVAAAILPEIERLARIEALECAANQIFHLPDMCRSDAPCSACLFDDELARLSGGGE
jgi:hypothetical protein